ncbi:unnamed protein product [Symbiodinium sp. CCMP2592]|nr:unnamed protein product [Symbiodinium sp. CCMP2592]
MWPQTLILAFFFRPRPPQDEKAAFAKKRSKLLQQLPDWSHILVKPDCFDALAAELPELLQSQVRAAWAHGTTSWVERADMVKVLAVWFYGGLAIDSLDEDIKDPKRLEEWRSISPLLVPGNFGLNNKTVPIEPDTFAGERGDAFFLDLLGEISCRIVGRKKLTRGNGPSYAICGSFVPVARQHGTALHNIVHRTMCNVVTCIPPDGQDIFRVQHAVTWTAWNDCPKTWLEQKPWKKASCYLKKSSKTPKTKKSSKVKKKVNAAYHATSTLKTLLADPASWSLELAPESVRKYIPQKGYMKIKQVPEQDKRSFAMACMLYGRQSDERHRYLANAVSKDVLKARLLSDVRSNMAKAKGKWTSKLLKFLAASGRGGSR